MANLQAQEFGQRVNLESSILWELATKNFSTTRIQNLLERSNQKLSSDHSDWKAWTQKANCHHLLGERSQASEAYRKALYSRTQDTKAEIWFAIGLFYYDIEVLAKAEPAFLVALRIDPEFSFRIIIYLKLALLYLKTSQTDKAFSYFEKCANCNDSNFLKSVALCFYGNTLEKQNKLAQATEKYREAMQCHFSAQTVGCLVWGLILHELFEPSLMLLDNLFKSCSVDSETLVHLNYLKARACIGAQNYQAALELLTETLKHNPENSLFWVTTGTLYFETEQLKDAYDCFMKALETNFDLPEAVYNIGLIYEKCKQKQEALAAFRRIAPESNVFEKAQSRINALLEELEAGTPSCIQPSVDIISVFFPQEKFTFVGISDHRSFNMYPVYGSAFGRPREEQFTPSFPPRNSLDFPSHKYFF
mmetsp:Transcript_14271/g.20860  ORF Transcript_14271/g.20860 Transcript_14271/m.20860 type:complete len:420 (-) Transcript_14271:316-1575(-)